MFTLETLATELGIDPATLQAKPDVAAKWNGYLSEADTKYREASQAKADAEASLKRIEDEQKTINDQIEKFGLTEARYDALQANYAAMEAQLKVFKEKGYDVNLPNTPAPVPAVDPQKKFQTDTVNAFNNWGNAMKVTARYQAIYGKPFTDDPVKLIEEAVAARLPVEQYAEQKYKFAEETQRQSAAELERKIAAGVEAGINKYKEEHPITAGNPDLHPGRASRNPYIMKKAEAQDTRKFANLSGREKIAASVGRTITALKSQAS